MPTLLEPFQYAFFRNGIAVATLAGALCGLVGVYVVLRGMSYVGHGLSHAIFGGAVASYALGVNASTVYRTLAVLEETGVLRHAHLEGGAEYHRVEESGHVHLTCSRCGSSEDLSADRAARLARAIAAATGFRPDLTHFAISGTCARCRRARR
jgi:hypothetical protein